MKSKLLKILLYIAMLFFVFFVLLSLTSSHGQSIVPENGIVDLRNADLSTELIQVIPQEWEYYPGELYGPDDFKGAAALTPAYGDNASTSEYGTYRISVMLPPGQIYAISGRSPNLSQRVFINGELAGEVGTPGTTREETTPRTKTYEHYFMAEGETTELIYQIANFHHRAGGRNTSFYLAQPNVISRYRALDYIRNNIILGCVLTVSLYFFGMYIFFSRRLHLLFLGFSAFVTAVRMLIIGEKHIMEIFPELNWFVSIKLEYICLLLFVVFLLLYFHCLYPGMFHKKYIAVVLLFSTVFLGIVLISKTPLFTQVQQYYVVLWVISSLVTLYGLFQKLREKSIHTVLIFSGFLTFFVTAVYDELRYLLIDHIRLDNTLIVGMLICLYMNMIAVTLEFSETEKKLSDTRVAILLSQIQPHFLFNVLIVIHQLCDLSPKQAKETILEFSSFLRSNMDSLFVKEPIPFEQELAHVKTYVSLEKKRFDEKVHCVYDIGCSAFSLPALTLQPIVENAVRYGITKKEAGGTVTVSTRERESCFVISVTDDGVGFDPLQKIQDGRSHVGLENVRNRLAATCGGKLHIHSTISVGTEVIIEIPKKSRRRLLAAHQ